MRHLREQRGQALSEFVVAAAFVVVPLFLIVPVVGKYIDMKLAAIQATRYSAWEYTVNYNAPEEQSSGFRGYGSADQPLKTRERVVREAQRRFYSDTALAIDSQEDRGGYRVEDANPLWHYHNGLPMYQPAVQSSLEVKGPLDTPDTTGVARTAMRAFAGFAEFIGGLLEAVGVPAGFDSIDTRGRFTAGERMPVRPAPSLAGLDGIRSSLFGKPLNLHMQAKAGVLGQSWSAGGRAHTTYQAGGLVPTPVLGAAYKQFAGPFFRVLSQIPLLNVATAEFAPDSLIFGYPVQNPEVMDQVPPGKLAEDERELQCEGGYCVY